MCHFTPMHVIGSCVCSRRLWETAESANGARVVGVVGAAHVPAIRSMWSEAGTPQFEHLCEAYMTVPQQPRLGFSTTLPTIATGEQCFFLAACASQRGL
ncbi:hypothetical protein COCSUDRAFT_32529 [Coccomyxa subellipsoidea C-169]|uniref:Uncharacterized protein n=1 Tax=Coccomyxa subellipsoidea (strain C-169) TaxID=574566 RepID=I0Z2W6_COCSC|nr:hypothetical protein COCSUDRAFT_32529 [Coccomyxa subellipsoidea C-169]EIE24985.1 hypothetical protein COCSUDRAFT_32529 [Coccomyxa subellipsoidea C-169]|eukprot:XP_005649529.1 hypothetical protein COCSUDRAFT_32529 [Coccomyxa subellipsoidea C-169]